MIESLSIIPFFVSGMVISIAWMYLGAPRVGILNKLLINIFGPSGDLLNIYSIWG